MCQVWCNGIADIYAQLGVSICHGYMCIVLYMKLTWCNGFAEIYPRSAMRCDKCGVAVLKTCMLNLGVSICHGYMCIVLYMKLIWCNGSAEIYAQLDGCQSAMGVCALCYI